MPLPDAPDHSQPAAAGSVTRLLPGLKAGEQDAVRQLWERYFQPLARVAASRMNPARCRVVAPEDVAQDVLLEFCTLLASPDGADRFPRLQTRENVWKLLVCFTARAAFDHNTKEGRRAEILAGESALGEPGFAAFTGGEPAPEFAAAVADLIDQLADPKRPEQGEKLQTIALMKMEGYEHTEIAARLGCSTKTVERKVELIRTIWKTHAPVGDASQTPGQAAPSAGE